jgi:hypothetical protein
VRRLELTPSERRGTVGYLLFWFTGAEMGARQIGTDAKETAPRLLIVDGQQRLTSLFAVLTGTPIVTKNYTEGRIRIAFRPDDARFEVTDAAIERDPEFIADITEVWRGYKGDDPTLPGTVEAAPRRGDRPGRAGSPGGCD